MASEENVYQSWPPGPSGAPRKYTSHVLNSLDPVWEDEETFQFAVEDEFEGQLLAMLKLQDVESFSTICGGRQEVKNSMHTKLPGSCGSKRGTRHEHMG